MTTTEVGADQARQALVALRTEIGKAVVGQDTAVTALVLALLCRGHVLLEGVPGTAKTLMVRALSTAMRLDTKRVSPISAKRRFSFPAFCSPIVLKIQLSRTPAKTRWFDKLEIRSLKVIFLRQR